MTSLESPDVKAKYDGCRYKVRKWELQFKKVNGRLPSKLDIREASREVRDAYKTYYRLKTAALEESLMNIDGFDCNEDGDSSFNVSDSSLLINTSLNTSNQLPNEKSSDQSVPDDNTPAVAVDQTETPQNQNKVWGEHLSNKTKPTSSNKKDESKSLSIARSFSQKLFQRSKPVKLPRKSLSFSRKRSETGDVAKPEFLSQPSCSSSPVCDTDQFPAIPFQNSNVKTASASPNVVAHSISIYDSFSQAKTRNIDAGWMKRVTESTNVVEGKFAPVDYDSDDVIENSEDEADKSDLHVAKKRKTCSGGGEVADDSSLITVDVSTRRLDFGNIFNKNSDEISTTVNGAEKSSTLSQSSQSQVEDCKSEKSGMAENDKNPAQSKGTTIIDNEDKEIRNSKTSKSKQKPKQNTKKSVKKKQSTDDDKTQTVIARKSSRQRKTIVDLQQDSDSSEKDPFSCDSFDDPDFHPNDTKEGSNDENLSPKPTTKTKAITSKENDKESYELEYSVKARIVTVPRIKSIKSALISSNLKEKKSSEKSDGTSTSTKNKNQQALEKLEQKVKSGTLNENYVHLDLKKKIYARGKRPMNYSSFKKKMWKNKKKALYGPDMDMGGCDGGVLKCFKCGEAGHFARRCTFKEDALLPLDAVDNDEELSPYPTLEEAARMAKISQLVIRKSNLIDKAPQEDGESNLVDKTQKQNQSDSSDGEEERVADSQEEDEEQFNEIDDENLLVELDRVEEEIRKFDVKYYLDHTTQVKPYYHLNEDGSIIDTPLELYRVLKLFGHSGFRNGQEQAIMRILSGKSTLLTLSTGSGKSLCYQIPAYMYSKREPCISLIISPLVSLMEDQVTGIPLFLKAACLHTNQTKTQKEKVMEALNSGNLNVLLVSPEAVVAGEKSTGFGSLLRKLPPIAFACIDEVHCVSQWSHNFRPSYLKLCHVLRNRLGITTILGLTATATRATTDSIIEHLCIPDGRDGIIGDIPIPSNLRLTVSRDVNRDQALLQLLESEEFVNFKSIIVYCIRREECERVATFLRTCLRKEENKGNSDVGKKRKRLNVQAEFYHAGMSAGRRRTIQKAFMSGELRIVVATVAFGMGINKSDIRAVIHYNMPMSFESYVQEVGRAGRDGLPAHCHLFLDSQGRDENELRRHIYANSIDRHIIRKLLQQCFVSCSCKSQCPRHEVAFSIKDTVQALDITEENIETLLCYLELHPKRYIELLSHAYVNCKVISYGSVNHIRKAAGECVPLAMALALYKKPDGDKGDSSSNVFEFPVIEVAAAMGWDSGICKHKLKNLEWTAENNLPKRSKLNVELSNLGFRLLSPGNLSDSDLDRALDELYERVKEQQRTSLLQLHAVHTVIRSVATNTYKSCITDKASENEDKLKTKIREYFESPKPLENLPEMQTKTIDEQQIANDTRALVYMYRDNEFTGTAVARIFHGIQSPNYPALMWGRCKFWRSHLGTDFNAVSRIAGSEILKMRQGK